ncbi:MAG TPA: hypothetical protein PKW35_07075, partial [Nannocystaceae bacterium]|nr:hypothetical protein [Nannocystaceae bacterium]
MALQPADFPRLLGQAESNPDWQKILRHNAAVLRAIHGGVAIALEAPVAFDPIADYWYRIERRALIAYLAERYAGRPTAAFRVVRDFALKATRHLDALRTSGEISHVGLDYRGGLRPHIAPLIRALETLPPVEGWADFVAANPKRRILPSPAQDLRVFLADLVAAKDFDEPAFNVRLPWWSYLGARSPAELRARQRFFFAYVHALTPVNSYRTAGSQFFAPVLQNTPTTHLLDALRAWRDGKDPGSHPLLGRGNNDAEHVNKSDNNIVRETWGFINLARAPQFNNQSAFLFDRPPRKEAIIPALITIGRQTRAWLDANPVERERAAQLFDRLLAEARRDAGRQEWTIFEPAVGEGDDAPVDLELSRELQGRAAADLLARPELDRA